MVSKASAVFLVVLLIILVCSVLYGSGFHISRDELSLSQREILDLEQCQVDGSILPTIAESSVVCFPRTEIKRDITLLSTYPTTGASLIRSIYEETTGIAAYTQYSDEAGTYTQACDFQSGPWKLYCRENTHEEQGGCKKIHPPPPEVPYFVNSNYPIWSDICDGFGYALPRHEAIVHIVRNPVDNIEAWAHYDFGKNTSSVFQETKIEDYFSDFLDWHLYWQDHHKNNPSVPTLWIRYEDLCMCTLPAIEKILYFADASDKVDSEELIASVGRNPCSERREIGKGLSYFTHGQISFILNHYSDMIKHFGYYDLMKQFTKHFEDPDSSDAMKDFHHATFHGIPYGAHPTDEYCRDLLAVDWNWDNALG